MKFRDLGGTPATYRGREYMTWSVQTGPGVQTTFADIALHDALDAHGELGNWLDDRIGYYVHPDEDVADAVEEYND